MKGLALFSRQLRRVAGRRSEPILGRVWRGSEPVRRGAHELRVITADEAPLPGFGAHLLVGQGMPAAPFGADDDAFAIGPELEYLDTGDVVVVEPDRHAVRVLYRRSAFSNTLLLTERCNHLCVMCSQPPKKNDDSFLVDEILRALPLMDPAAPELGFTGGEPTLLEDRFFEVIAAAKAHLPQTSLDVLTNGRRFADAAFTARLAELAHPDLVLGIPLYADISDLHDYVVQAPRAFDETIRGLLNLRRYRLRTEIRFVIHRVTLPRLVAFAEFVARNLTFVDHVALMGLELMGYARSNLDALWIDPWDYREELSQATRVLARSGMRVSIYNHPLCVVPEDVRGYAVKSISDWKNAYPSECEPCSKREECAGFFVSSTLRYSSHLAPFVTAKDERPNSTGGPSA